MLKDLHNPFELAALHDYYRREGEYFACLIIEKRAKECKSGIIEQLPYYKPIKKVPVFLLN